MIVYEEKFENLGLLYEWVETLRSRHPDVIDYLEQRRFGTWGHVVPHRTWHGHVEYDARITFYPTLKRGAA